MLATAADTAVVLVAALHLWFLVLEMFLWDKPVGRRTFGMTPAEAAATKALAMNQGLTASRKIRWVQALPGLVALILVLLRPGALPGA